MTIYLYILHGSKLKDLTALREYAELKVEQGPGAAPLSSYSTLLLYYEVITVMIE